MKSLLLIACLLVMGLLASGCSSPGKVPPPANYQRFEDYQQQTLAWLTRRRAEVGRADPAEAALNAPQEWRPAGAIRGGVLLVHGLGDSPWSFHDLGPALARQGFVARTVLLPGHGTQAGDMLDVTLEQWRDVVDEQADLLRRDAGTLYLGGFSTGANLVLDHAYRRQDVAGLLLFSPAFRSSVPLGWLAPVLRHVRPWLIDPEPAAQALPVRYGMVPTNGFAQFHRSSLLAQAHLASGAFHQPVLMVLAEGDSVVDVAHAADAFHRQFTHPASRLVWYGSHPPQGGPASRLTALPDALPAWRISQFSHMGILFSPDNPLYGQHGALKLCRNSRDEQAIAACLEGAEVWYSDWGYAEPGKVHARLTFNPYFEQLTRTMADVLAVGGGS
ncbi:alpha/beta hydrolase [Roseateles amylovorans]|uniref:Lysophospholipase n=1 Tax=Roseateles amylovorans TaxID=2978473 RepID=A0ABY6AYY7_9BURK|nr:lysophospholipase [Roseateles amylovorans]UXH78386.1 lysophospholipase [Roseateles amylovorans]